MAFDSRYDNLGTRIVRAARLAAAVHLYESARGDLLGDQGDTSFSQQVVIGGAGPCLVTDDHVTDDGVGNDGVGTDNRRRVEPSSRAGGAARWKG